MRETLLKFVEVKIDALNEDDMRGLGVTILALGASETVPQRHDRESVVSVTEDTLYARLRSGHWR